VKPTDEPILASDLLQQLHDERRRQHWSRMPRREQDGIVRLWYRKRDGADRKHGSGSHFRTAISCRQFIWVSRMRWRETIAVLRSTTALRAAQMHDGKPVYPVFEEQEIA
jgi:hypothetical protein